MTEHEKIQEIIRLKDQAPITIDPLKSALLIVDVQRYFARRITHLRKLLKSRCRGQQPATLSG